MKTVLLVWELGAGLGHVAPLLQLARRIAAAGHRPVFALRDVVGPRALLFDSGFDLLQSPVWPRPLALRGRPFTAASYADILAACGFARADDLGAMVDAWDALLGYLKPDLIVADHSPHVCLAAHGALPLALLGNGFTLPPVDGPVFPSLQTERPPAVPEHRLLEAVALVQRRRGRTSPATLPALFAAPVRAVMTFPELDPYRTRRREPLCDPFEPLPRPTPLPEPPRVFAYLGAEYPAIDALVQTLVDSRLPLTVYLRGDAGPLPRFLASRGAELPERPPPFAEVVPRAAVVISHAGSTVVHAAFAGGRPQLLLPMQFEAGLTARTLEALGTGIRLYTGATAPQIADALGRLVGDVALRDQAAAWAGLVAERGPGPSLDAVAADCLALL